MAGQQCDAARAHVEHLIATPDPKRPFDHVGDLILSPMAVQRCSHAWRHDLLNHGLEVPIGKVVAHQHDGLCAKSDLRALSWRGGSESDRVPPDLDQRLGLAPRPIAKR